MRLRSFSLAALVMAGGLLALASPAPFAQDKKKAPDVSESVEADPVLERATTAYRIAEDGRKYKIPEALVAAGLMLRSLKTVTKTAITEIPTDENGKPVEEKALEDKSFAREADDLFEDALAMALTSDIKGFDAVIKIAKSREETRYLAGGAKSIRRRIGPGKTEVFHFKFRDAEPTYWAFNSTRPLHIKAVRTDYNHVWVDAMHHHYHHYGPPAGGKRGNLAPVTFRIHNPHKREHAEYHLFIK